MPIELGTCPPMLLMQLSDKARVVREADRGHLWNTLHPCMLHGGSATLATVQHQESGNTSSTFERKQANKELYISLLK